MSLGVEAARRIPPTLKVLMASYGIRELAASSLRTLAAVLAAAAVPGLTPLLHLPRTPLAGLAVFLAAAYAVRGFDLAGKLMMARGRVLENLSETRRARRLYRSARFLLADASEALVGLVDTAGGARRAEAVRRLARAARRTGKASLALRVVDELSEAGDGAAALRYCRGLSIGGHPTVVLREARLLLSAGAPADALARLDSVPFDERDDEMHSLRAMILSDLDQHDEAIVEMGKAVALRGFHAAHHDRRARILMRAGRSKEALDALDRCLFLHRKNPGALMLRAGLCSRLGRPAAAHRSLRKALFYDNTNVQAFLRLRSMRRRGRDRFPLPESPDAGLRVSLIPETMGALVGETLEVTIRLESRRSMAGCMITVLEPYGGGLEALQRFIHAGRIDAGSPFETSLLVIGKRPTDVNLGRPWRLVVVAAGRDAWTSAAADIDLRDASEGEAHLVITNDHETAIRRERMEGGGRGYITPEEARSDLVMKMRAAHAVGEPLGVRWTHMLDAGTAVGMVRWAAERSQRWKPVSEELAQAYNEALARSHDLQLHLHLSAVPDSYFFCYRLDRDTDELEFDRARKESYFPGWQVNSWARVTPRFGPSASPDSRLGSLRLARAEVSAVISRERVPVSGVVSQPRVTTGIPLLFRAGQWDFGETTADRDVSFVALREAGLLADSSATSGGSLHSRRFSFGSAPAGACYFTRGAEVSEKARTLLEAGLTEVLPVLQPQGRHPVTPRDDPSPVIHAYRRLVKNDRVAPGRHIFMEMEHLATLPDPGSDDSGAMRQWQAVGRHFLRISRHCPRLRKSGAREALESWWDYYSPELIALPGEPRTVALGEGVSMDSFPLRFLGSSMLCRDTRLVAVVILFPHCERAERATVRLMNDQRCIWQGRYAGRTRVFAILPLSLKARDTCRLELVPEAAAAKGAKTA